MTNSMPKPKRTKTAKKMAALAGSLAAVGAMPADSHAAIQHTTGSPVTASFADSDGFTTGWDIDGDGNQEATLNVHTGDDGEGQRGSITASSVGDNSFYFLITSSDTDLPRLAASQNIGPTSVTDNRAPGNFSASQLQVIQYEPDLSSGNIVLGTVANGTGTGSGTAVQDGDNYIGFTFLLDGENVYGWANLNIDLTNGVVSITEWAYQDEDNTAIHVADTTSGGAGVVPEPSSLALLAMGAGGLFAYRARQKKRSAEDTV